MHRYACPCCDRCNSRKNDLQPLIFFYYRNLAGKVILYICVLLYGVFFFIIQARAEFVSSVALTSMRGKEKSVEIWLVEMWCLKTYTNSTVHIDENLIEEPINGLFNIECPRLLQLCA